MFLIVYSISNNHFQFLISDFLTIVNCVKLEVRPLLLPHLVKLTSIIEPGLTELTWVSSEWKLYSEDVREAIRKFKELVERVHDVYTNRVQEILAAMQVISLHALPDCYDEPWTIEYFLEKNEGLCRFAANELHRKSLMVEEAVEEILALVKRNPWEGEFFFEEEDHEVQTEAGSNSSQQQSDWSLVWECFERPHLLLHANMCKSMMDLVKGAVGEMRRFYSRKVVDVLVKVTRQSLDAIRRRFSPNGIFQIY